MKVHSRRLAQSRHTQPFAIDACITNFYDIQDVQEKNVPMFSYQSYHNYFLLFLIEAKCLLNAKHKYPIKI